MAAMILPSIMAVGLIGLLAAKFTPIFDILGLTLYPFTWLAQFGEPMQAAKALASGLAEMFLPAILLKEAVPEGSSWPRWYRSVRSCSCPPRSLACWRPRSRSAFAIFW